MSPALPCDLPATTDAAEQSRVLHPAAQLDAAEALHLRQQILDALEDGSPRLVLDMADVDFIDSTGLGVLVGGLKRARAAGGDLQLSAPSRTVVKVLRITGLNKIFDVVPRPAG